MPRFADQNAQLVPFAYSGVALEKLATENTAATIIIDFSTSVRPYASDLRKALIDEIHALQHERNKRRLNTVLRVCAFTNNGFPGFLEELLPFTNLLAVKPDSLPAFNPSGNTPLYGATLRALQDGLDFAKALALRKFTCNVHTCVITDGAQYSYDDHTKPKDIKAAALAADDEGVVESSFLQVVGIDVATCKSQLEMFCREAGIPERISFVDVLDSTPQRLAKGMGFVSKSIESTATAAGSASASKSIPAIATI